MMQSQLKETSDRGATLLEFSLVLPFVLFLLTGVVEGGRIFTHLTWLSQLAFQTAMAGVDDPDPVASQNAMTTRFNTLFQAQSARRNLQGESANPAYNVDGTNRLVTVTLNGTMSILNQMLPPMGFSLSVTVPQLIDQAALTAGPAQSDGYANPTVISMCNLDASIGTGFPGTCNSKICNGISNTGVKHCYCRIGESDVIPCS